MIPISKEEAAEVRATYPGVRIVRTMIQKSKRHHYYMTEHEGAMRLIAGNSYADAIVAEIDEQRALRDKQRNSRRARHNGK